ncbi:putative zinc transporter msc2 [Podila clonocystis]|nr:putative zinc transporter msc2 [Podila clonocystis]
MINLDKITTKLIQAASAHFLREWIHLEHKPLAVVLFWMLLAAGAILLVIERPGSRPGFGTWKWNKILPYGAALAGQMYLWLWGLSTLSTLRTLLLTQYADIWMVAVLAALVGKRSKSQGQYSFVVLGGILASFILDVCYAPAGSNVFTIGSGYIALMASAQLAIYQRGVARRLSTELGSMKTLHAVSVATAAGLLGPLALIQYLISPSSGSTVYTHSPSWILYLVLGVGLFVIDFYVNQSINQRVAPVWHVLSGWPIVLISSCFTGLLLTKSIGANLLDFIIAIVMLYGIHELLQAEALNSESRFASEEGLSDDLPTHDHPSYSSLAGQYTTGGLADLSVYVKAILADQDSKQIFYFLLLNLSFMFVQMLYGVWTNSLGLISDSIHMFFDCLALGVGLFASVMSKWNANRTFTYGYNRIETLSGFSNGIFLSLISIFIVIEAIERLVHPPEMNTHRLLLVSFLGFVVNMVGIFAFNHGHAHHGHSHGHDHGHGHGHDHHGHNANMQGVFLHIMADTLGSVGVIISTLLIDWFGWTGFDPIASMFIAVLIFLSVIPLIKDSAAVLMLEVPDANLGAIEHALGELTNIPGVASHSCARFWPNSPESMIGSIHIQVNGSGGDSSSIQHAVEQALLTNIHGLSEVSVQVEKEGMGGFQSCFCNGSSELISYLWTDVINFRSSTAGWDERHEYLFIDPDGRASLAKHARHIQALTCQNFTLLPVLAECGCTNLVELNYVIKERGPITTSDMYEYTRMPTPASSTLGLDHLAKLIAANPGLQSVSIENVPELPGGPSKIAKELWTFMAFLSQSCPSVTCFYLAGNCFLQKNTTNFLQTMLSHRLEAMHPHDITVLHINGPFIAPSVAHLRRFPHHRQTDVRVAGTLRWHAPHKGALRAMRRTHTASPKQPLRALPPRSGVLEVTVLPQILCAGIQAVLARCPEIVSLHVDALDSTKAQVTLLETLRGSIAPGVRELRVDSESLGLEELDLLLPTRALAGSR